MPHDESFQPSLTSVPLVSVAVNAALASIKILAGFFGNSYALIADGIESTADIVTSLVVWGGLRVSVAPSISWNCTSKWTVRPPFERATTSAARCGASCETRPSGLPMPSSTSNRLDRADFRWVGSN